MKYKVIVNGEAQAIWNTDKRYTLYSDTATSNSKDKVILTFDERNQIFVARIENPSSHTLYLFNNGKLGIGITKCNFGARAAYHWGGSVTTNKVNTHPRWSRVHQNVTIVDDLDHIEIPARSFRYSEHKTVSNKTIVWNFFRGLLLHIAYRDNQICNESCRGYKTNCKSLKLNYNKSTKQYFVPTAGESIIDVNVTNKGNNTYQIFINNITGSFLNMYQNNQLMLGMKVFGPVWVSSDKGWGCGCDNRANDENSHRCDIAAERGTDKTHKGLRCTGQIINNLMFNYTIPQWIVNGVRPKESLTDLSYSHRTFDVKINCYYSIYLYYKPTGHAICTLVDHLLPYTWYEDSYWDYNDK